MLRDLIKHGAMYNEGNIMLQRIFLIRIADFLVSNFAKNSPSLSLNTRKLSPHFILSTFTKW